jgi:hypothetical protein
MVHSWADQAIVHDLPSDNETFEADIVPLFNDAIEASAVPLVKCLHVPKEK